MRTIRDLPQRAIDIEMMRYGEWEGRADPPTMGAGPMPVDAVTGHPLACVLSCVAEKDYDGMLVANIRLYAGVADEVVATPHLAQSLPDRILSAVIHELRKRGVINRALRQIKEERPSVYGDMMADVKRRVAIELARNEPCLRK